jgi:hypothetical protein
MEKRIHKSIIIRLNDTYNALLSSHRHSLSESSERLLRIAWFAWMVLRACSRFSFLLATLVFFPSLSSELLRLFLRRRPSQFEGLCRPHIPLHCPPVSLLQYHQSEPFHLRGLLGSLGLRFCLSHSGARSFFGGESLAAGLVSGSKLTFFFFFCFSNLANQTCIAMSSVSVCETPSHGLSFDLMRFQ